ncbi:MAG: peptide-N-glycosidase F-related protein [Croceimicrobium sp.]
MMKYIYSLFLSLSILFSGLAADGDTTLVSAHQQRDLTWYGSYKDWAVFPSQTNNWHQIILKYTMGCASGGCSDWDYTTVVDLLIPTGALDSSIASIDTISLNPLQIDTTWNITPVKEAIELCKVITPYGGSLPQNWQRDFYFDVSNYAPLLKDSIEINVRYQGWSSGFSASLDFHMIEGKPVRDVYKIENLYRGGFTYRTTAQFETNHMPSRALDLHPSATHFDLKMAPSGHGFVNALNCAEFCERDYYVFVDGQKVAEQNMWRDDCGLNDLWPQAGTWLYDRANWCPGDRVNEYHHDLSAYLPNADSINIDVEPYTYTVPPGESPASYNMLAQLFHLGDFNQDLDIALADIIKPSNNDEHARFNPVCDHAVILVQNRGSLEVTSLEIAYGLKGNTQWRNFNWTGSLMPLEFAEITLPMDLLQDWTSLNGKLEFVAQIERVNGQVGDEIAFNDRLSSPIVLPQMYPNPIRFELRTNAAASETWWKLYNASGMVIDSGDNFANNTTYRDTFDLDPGCYHLVIGDRDKDGLSFFANSDGSGRILMRNVGGNFFNETYNPNFGTELRQYFTVGYSIGLEDEIALSSMWSIYPNPSKGQIKLDWGGPDSEEIKLRLSDTQGRILWQKELNSAASAVSELQMPEGLNGLYFMELSTGTQIDQKAIMLQTK